MKKDSFEKKLAAYVAMATAYLAAHPVETNAQILYTDMIPDDTIQNSFFNLDLNNDGINDFKFVHDRGSYVSSYGSYFSSWNKAFLNPLGANKAVKYLTSSNFCSYGPIPVPFNFIIDQNLGFGIDNILLQQIHTNSIYGFYSGFWSNGCFWDNAEKYIGLKVLKNGSTYYGWARVQVIPNLFSGKIILKDYAINLTPNALIQAGVIPTCPMPGNPHTTSITNHSAKLNWSTQSPAIGYRIRYKKVGTTAWNLSVVPSNNGFKTINNLSPNSNYEWQVRTICQQTPLVWSSYTASQFFATPLRLEDETIDASVTETQNELFIYPNPATNEIHLLIGEGGDYELKIFNMLGQQVAVEKINLQQDESVTVSTSNLPSGTYQILVTSNEGNFVGRFVKE